VSEGLRAIVEARRIGLAAALASGWATLVIRSSREGIQAEHDACVAALATPPTPALDHGVCRQCGACPRCDGPCTCAAPAPSRSAAEMANGIVRQWDDEGGYNARRLSVLIARVADALTAAQASAVERYAKTVDDPARMHLHYDGCPFKPFADMRRDEIPDPRPECTCAEAHMAAYWKGQWMLEHGQAKLDVASAREAVWEEAIKVACEYCRRGDFPLTPAGYHETGLGTPAHRRAGCHAAALRARRDAEGR
jgi:hypothetical protein